MKVIETQSATWIHKEGSPPPLKIRNLVKRVSARHPHLHFAIRWIRCGRGCTHGRAFSYTPAATADLISDTLGWNGLDRYIRLYYGVSESENLIVMLHEMAHHIRGTVHWHDEGFFRALVREAKAEGMLREVVSYHGRNAKKALRQIRAEDALTKAS